MRKFYLFAVLLLIFCTNSFAQTYNNPGGTINTCSGTFYDTGGNGSPYGNSQNIITTFCSNNGTCLSISFTAFNIESGWDFLYIYDGPTTASPLIGTYTGTGTPGTVVSSTGCLTFRFTSDGSIANSGWAASISCIPCPPPSYNNPGGTINTCAATFYDTGGNGGAYGNSQNITTTFCSNNGTCLQAVFNSFNIENGWDYLYIYDGPNTGSPLIGTYTGTTTPPSVVSSGGCLTFRFTSDGSVTA